MNYTYPTIQNTVQGTIFLMSESCSPSTDIYTIKYRHKGELLEGRIMYKDIVTGLLDGSIKKQRTQTFSNNAEFIKIPIEKLKHV